MEEERKGGHYPGMSVKSSRAQLIKMQVRRKKGREYVDGFLRMERGARGLERNTRQEGTKRKLRCHCAGTLDRDMVPENVIGLIQKVLSIIKRDHGN